MRKTLVILALVALITLVAVTPALAGRGGPGGHGGGGGGGGRQSFFSLVGTITAVDRVNDTITVQTLNDRFAGQVLTVQMTESTRFLRWTADGSVPITFADVEADDSTNIKGTVADGAFIADMVTVDVPLYCYP